MIAGPAGLRIYVLLSPEIEFHTNPKLCPKFERTYLVRRCHILIRKRDGDHSNRNTERIRRSRPRPLRVRLIV